MSSHLAAGGGYQYRLCPADRELTEECFKETPLDFVRAAHAIMWNNGTLHRIKGQFVDDSVCPVEPKGSTWARNPCAECGSNMLPFATLRSN